MSLLNSRAVYWIFYKFILRFWLSTVFALKDKLFGYMYLLFFSIKFHFRRLENKQTRRVRLPWILASGVHGVNSIAEPPTCIAQ
jgi:hypothetical protein